MLSMRTRLGETLLAIARAITRGIGAWCRGE